MNWNPDIIGRGYNESILRIEHRPAKQAHSREELTAILDSLQQSGVQSWWYSVSAKGSFPLFPSKVLPHLSCDDPELYPWLVEEAHKRDIVLYSWEYLNTAPLLTQEHPDWKVQFLKGPEIFKGETDRHSHFVCFNSPYGELLKDYCVEVVNDIGFDGIWFDGCYLFGPADDGYRWSCCCEHCAKKFRDETGLDIPKQINWADPVFHEYLQWRYRFFNGYWKDLSNYVRAQNSTALLAFNFFNRVYMGAVSGSPLTENKIDAMTVGEGTVKTVAMQIKTLRAVNDSYPPEVWTNLHDGTILSYPNRPEPDPTSAIFYTETAASAGGFASFGVGESPLLYRKSLSEMSKALAPLKDNVGGTHLCSCAVLYSGINKDFYSTPIPGDTHFASKNKPPVDNLYGTGFLLDSLHYPFDIVLDDQLHKLDKYQALILPEVRCMSDKALEQLSSFVSNGGTLIALGECGTATPTGAAREQGVLDSLFGINGRRGHLDYCILENFHEELTDSDLPELFMISGKARLLDVADDVEILAMGRYPEVRKAIANHDCLTDDASSERSNIVSDDKGNGAAIIRRTFGKGKCIYMAPAIGSNYSQNPNRRSRKIFSLLTGGIAQPFHASAPPNVVTTLWKHKDRLCLHLLNQPQAMQLMHGYGTLLSPEDFLPSAPIEIRINGSFTRAESPDGTFEFKFIREDNACILKIPSLLRHAIINIF